MVNNLMCYKKVSCLNVFNLNSVFGKTIASEASLQALRNLQHHLVNELGAEPLDRWTVEVSLISITFGIFDLRQRPISFYLR